MMFTRHADGYAAQELHVVLKILYEATLERPSEENSSEWTIMKSKINAKRQEISRIRQLASQIPQSGAALFDLLHKEVVARRLVVVPDFSCLEQDTTFLRSQA
uniref:NR LBD domain-containing protein n=1 Tax=Steinernema glaseri TaxID=37863 RepID=A0A1I8AKC1_9BILA